MVTGVVADVSGLGLVDSKVPGGGGGGGVPGPQG